jgi:hypothetical protein
MWLRNTGEDCGTLADSNEDWAARCSCGTSVKTAARSRTAMKTGLPRGRRVVAGRLSLVAPGDRRSGCRASAAGGGPEKDRSGMLPGGR